MALRYKALTDRHRTKTAVVTMDRKWFPMQASGMADVERGSVSFACFPK